MAIEEGFSQGSQFFNAQDYFEAHEAWEALWLDAQGARHAFLQGMIQVAVGLHHAQNENWKGARSLFSTALGYLEKGKSDCEPVDIPKLVDHVLDCELAIQARLKGEDSEIPYFPVPEKD